MRYRDAAPPGQPADRVVVLQPGAWSALYPKRPEAPVALGLRLPTERELLTAHAEATKEAQGRSDGGFRFREALVCWTLAAALCDPNNAGQPYLERADEEVRDAFPDETLRHLWHELERLRIETSPTRPEITPEETRDLVELLDGDALDRADPRVRRLLRFCLDELQR